MPLPRSIARRRPTRSRPRRSGPSTFPRSSNAHIDDGIRFFLEVGPGSSCTRLIGQILRGRPHVAISACRPDRDALAAPILDVLAGLISHRLPVNLAGLYGYPTGARCEHRAAQSDNKRRHKVRVEVEAERVSKFQHSPRGRRNQSRRSI